MTRVRQDSKAEHWPRKIVRACLEEVEGEDDDRRGLGQRRGVLMEEEMRAATEQYIFG